MPRPCCCRKISHAPRCGVFKPAGVAVKSLEEIVLTLDEFEAIRKADLDGLYQEQAAEHMNVSRQTFGRIIESARKKIARALVEGAAIRIEGGTVEMNQTRHFKCADCKQVCDAPFGQPRPMECPSCKSGNLHRLESERGPAHAGRGFRRCCGRGSGHSHGRK